VASKREQIQLSGEEVSDFLAAERTVICATNGKDGWPHLMPLWFVVRDGELWAWTFAKSQKIKNIERDPRATMQVETGEQYQELRGVMLECEVVLHREPADVEALGLEIFQKYTGIAELPDAVREMVAKQAPKRVAMQFVERRRASWDHSKLGGAY
jgi:PPOX class probable F420-dependent enzyme